MDKIQIVLAQIQIDTLPQIAPTTARLTGILNWVFTLIGAISLLVITIAGFRYVISHGDPSLIAQSKNAIIYALIGLLISISALGIINFVIDRV